MAVKRDEYIEYAVLVTQSTGCVAATISIQPDQHNEYAVLII